MVTGGSRGIGAACARAFAAAGASVLIHYRERAQAAEEVLASLPLPSGEPHLAGAADLAHPARIEELFARVRREWGGLDCLVNNAGIWRSNPISELDPVELDEMLRVNLQAVFLCTRAAIPLMEGAKGASIVNLSSTAGQRGEAGHSTYAATKGAVIAATKSWAVELAPAIRVNAVAPGWVETDMSAGAYDGDGREAIEAGIPLGRVASPDEIAGPVLFLASSLASDVTGEILNVNGGSVLCG